MALPPAIAPAPPLHSNPKQHNPAQDSVQDQNIRDLQIAATSSPASSRDFDHSVMQRSGPSSPHEYGIDPAIGGAAAIMSTSNDSGGDDASADGRKGYGKRELSTSKRAAQNRAAQRAFRQRKEGYIKKLEEQVRDYQMMSENFKAVQAENYQLRDYIINLQSRLIDSHEDVPQPPPNIDLAHPSRRMQPDRHDAPGSMGRPSAMDANALASLRGGVIPSGHDISVPSKHYSDEDYGSDAQMAKRLRAEGAGPATAAQEALQGSAGAVEQPRITGESQTRDLTIGSVLNGSSRDGASSRQMLSA